MRRCRRRADCPRAPFRNGMGAVVLTQVLAASCVPPIPMDAVPRVYEFKRLPLRGEAPFVPKFMKERETYERERSRIATVED